MKTKSLNIKHLVVLVLSIVLVVVLYALPTAKEISKTEKEAIDLNKKVQEAVSIVNSSDNPMQGIMMLREVLAEDENHLQANFELGYMSIQSRQFEKAVGRFNTVIAIDSTVADAYYYLGMAYHNLNQNIEALESLKKFKKKSTDTEKLKTVEEIINTLN